jgi:hypothetical protein
MKRRRIKLSEEQFKNLVELNMDDIIGTETTGLPIYGMNSMDLDEENININDEPDVEQYVGLEENSHHLVHSDQLLNEKHWCGDEDGVWCNDDQTCKDNGCAPLESDVQLSKGLTGSIEAGVNKFLKRRRNEGIRVTKKQRPKAKEQEPQSMGEGEYLEGPSKYGYGNDAPFEDSPNFNVGESVTADTLGDVIKYSVNQTLKERSNGDTQDGGERYDRTRTAVRGVKRYAKIHEAEEAGDCPPDGKGCCKYEWINGTWECTKRRKACCDSKSEIVGGKVKTPSFTEKEPLPVRKGKTLREDIEKECCVCWVKVGVGGWADQDGPGWKWKCCGTKPCSELTMGFEVGKMSEDVAGNDACGCGSGCTDVHPNDCYKCCANINPIRVEPNSKVRRSDKDKARRRPYSSKARDMRGGRMKR